MKNVRSMDMRYLLKPKSLAMHGQLEEILNTALMPRSLFQSVSSIVQWTIRGHILSRSLLELEGEYVLVYHSD